VASVVADIFRRAARLNLEDARREGNTVLLSGGGRVLVAGDVHGHRGNLTKILAHAAVDRSPETRLVLQEVIHGPADPRTGHDRSVELLLRAVRLKIAHPEQVLFLLGNHDLSQATGNEVTKDGCGVCKAFEEGVRFCFGDEGQEVAGAVSEFLLSMPLAVRTAGGVLITHSLPEPKRMDLAGVDILRRPATPDDLHRGGPVYEWTWGRGQTPEQVDALAAALGVGFFVLGHAHAEEGFEMIAPRACALASDHDHGRVLEFPADAPLTAQNVGEHVKPIVALGRAD